jgi:hypothetical protein
MISIILLVAVVLYQNGDTNLQGIGILSKFALLLVMAGLISTPVYAQSTSHKHVAGMSHAETVLPKEPGQGAFAAFSEIVTLLTADPATDWSTVDITGLRNHLVDMDILVSDSVVTSRDVPGGLEIRVASGVPGNAAALRMVPTHAPFVQAETGWDSVVSQDGETLIWTVTAMADETQIRALGFFGLMATGDHHREHHLGMARGIMVH